MVGFYRMAVVDIFIELALFEMRVHISILCQRGLSDDLGDGTTY